MRNSGLGRGLSALMGEDITIETGIDQEYVHQLPISSIDVNKAQPRKTFHSETIAALAESIKTNGMLQPITVHKVGQRYEIVAGERRFRACRLLKMQTVPAIIKELSPRQVCELSLIENLQREDLNPIEEAAAIQALMEDFQLTQQEVSQRIGSSRPAIANALRLLKLPARVKEWIASGAISAGHGRAFAALEEENLILELAEKCVKEGWSVRETERRVAAAGKQKARKQKVRIPEFDRIEEKMRQRMGTKVTINGNDKKGKIEIEYFDRDDLERIIILLSGQEEF